MYGRDPRFKNGRQFAIDPESFDKWIEYTGWAVAIAFIIGMAYEFEPPVIELVRHTGRAMKAIFG